MSVILRAAAAYWILLLGVRLMGRRTVSMMAPFDLIVLFLLGGTTITAVLGNDHSMTAAFSAVCTIGFMHLLVSWLKTKSPVIGRIIDGTPVVIYDHGEWKKDWMQRLRIEPQDVMAAMRQSGIERMEQVRYAVVERDGKISVIEEKK